MIDTFKDNFHDDIVPVPADTVRPTWTVIIPTYNCAQYLRETLESVLIQDPGADEMEIIVVDDCSTKDDPAMVVAECGKNRVRFIQQKKNLGKSANYATGLKESKGKYIHILHGDDTVVSGFYDSILHLFNSFPEAGACFCQCNYINKDSIITNKTGIFRPQPEIVENFLEYIATWQLLQPPSVVFKRVVYETLGGYDARLKYMEDWEFYVRSATLFQWAYTPAILANYRVYPNNSSSLSILKGERIHTLNQILSIIDTYLPFDVKQKIQHERNKTASVHLINYIPKVVSENDWVAYWVIVKALLKYCQNIRLWGRFVRFTLEYKKHNR
jgi:glycosyltransferase involved in cell wall biosynthesis